MKRIIMAISVLAITALLSACGAGASPTNVAPETNQDSYSDLLLSEDSFSEEFNNSEGFQSIKADVISLYNLVRTAYEESDKESLSSFTIDLDEFDSLYNSITDKVDNYDRSKDDIAIMLRAALNSATINKSIAEIDLLYAADSKGKNSQLFETMEQTLNTVYEDYTQPQTDPVQETVQTVGETIAETDTVVTSNALQDEDINVDDRTEDLSEEIILDGIWLFDHIESNGEADAIKQAETSAKQYKYYISENKLYTFSDDGRGMYTTLELEEENAADSPVEIGLCHKYRIYGSDITSYNEAYFSNDYWVTPSVSEDGKIYAYYVYKKAAPIASGNNVSYKVDDSWDDRGFTEQVETEKLSVKIPLTSYVDISADVAFDHPESWEVFNSTDSTNSLSLSPKGDIASYEAICLLNNAYETVVSKPDTTVSREKNIEKYIEDAVADTTGLSIDNTEIRLIDGRIGSVSTGTWELNNGSYPVTIYTVSLEKGLIFSILCRSIVDGNDPYEQDEMALLRSVRVTYPRMTTSKIQLVDHDPDREIGLELDEVDKEEGNAGLPVLYVSGRGHELAHPKDIKAKAYYNRSTDNDIIDVKLEIKHNGETITSDIYKLSLGATVEFEDIELADDDLGYWLMRLINNDTGQVLSEYYFETAYKPKETKDTSAPEIGMTAEEVENTSWGKPDAVNETKTRYGVHEQWVYEGKGYVYLDDGIVTAIQTSR